MNHPRKRYRSWSVVIGRRFHGHALNRKHAPEALLSNPHALPRAALFDATILSNISQFLPSIARSGVSEWALAGRKRQAKCNCTPSIGMHACTLVVCCFVLHKEAAACIGCHVRQRTNPSEGSCSHGRPCSVAHRNNHRPEARSLLPTSSCIEKERSETRDESRLSGTEHMHAASAKCSIRLVSGRHRLKRSNKCMITDAEHS